MNKMICVAYVFFIAGMAINRIGNNHIPNTGAWTISEALFIIAFSAAPMVFGFLAGREK